LRPTIAHTRFFRSRREIRASPAYWCYSSQSEPLPRHDVVANQRASRSSPPDRVPPSAFVSSEPRYVLDSAGELAALSTTAEQWVDGSLRTADLLDCLWGGSYGTGNAVRITQRTPIHFTTTVTFVKPVSGRRWIGP
jgi:hypothetical protein